MIRKLSSAVSIALLSCLVFATQASAQATRDAQKKAQGVNHV
jgi:hypothetical protein